MARLPSPGGDTGNWGTILNDFLTQAHNDDGTLKDTGVLAAKYVKPGSGIPEADLASDVQTKLNAGGASATGASLGVIQLAGDLSGTATTPTVATGAITATKIANTTITNTQISGSAAIDQSKIANLTTDLAGKLPTSYLDTDGTLTANSDTKLPSQKAAKTYVDTVATGKVSKTGDTMAGDLDMSGNDINNVGNTFEAALAPTTASLNGSETVLGFQTGTFSNIPLSQVTGLSPVQSVAGRTGTVVLTKTDVGLANVDNTADASKPVSTAQQTALDAKVTKAGDTMTGTLNLDTATGMKIVGKLSGTSQWSLNATNIGVPYFFLQNEVNSLTAFAVVGGAAGTNVTQVKDALYITRGTGQVTPLMTIYDTDGTTVKGQIDASYKLSVLAGGTTSTLARVGGLLKSNITAVGNVLTGEDDLITFSIVANTMNTNLDTITAVFAGTIANNANAKRIRIKIGSTTLLDTGASGIATGAAIDWQARTTIIRATSTTGKATTVLNLSNGTSFQDYVAITETWANALVIKATGDATATNDVVQEMLHVRWEPGV